MTGDAVGPDPLTWATRALTEREVESPRLEAQLLLAWMLGRTRAAVIAGLFEPLDAAQARRFRDLVERRGSGVPLAYLRGTQEFYGLEFAVSPAVLIPRPETELLVDFVREALGGAPTWATLADVGTGSGCIPAAALLHCPRARGVAIDVSAKALKVARGNGARHRLTDRLRFVQSDLLAGIAAGSFDVIVSNPPYIATDAVAGLQREVRDSEPRLALEGGSTGLEFYHRLAPQMHRCLVPGGRLAVEVGMGQARDVCRIFASAAFELIETRVDLAGIERVVTARRPLTDDCRHAP